MTFPSLYLLTVRYEVFHLMETGIHNNLLLPYQQATISTILSISIHWVTIGNLLVRLGAIHHFLEVPCRVLLVVVDHYATTVS